MKTITRLFGSFTLAWALIAAAVCSVKGQDFLTNGLVAYYPFNGNANDASGNGNDGTPSNINFATDRFGITNSAASFPGNSQIGNNSVGDSFITINRTNLNLHFPFSVSAWAKCPSSVGGRIVSTAGYELAINGYNGAGMNVTDMGNTGASVESGRQLPFNVWQQILGVWDTNGLMSLYINGVIAGTNLTTFRPDYSRGFIPTIARNCGSSFDAFPGLIDDIRIYDRALSDSEIQQLYVMEAPPYVNIRKLVYVDAILNIGTNYQLQVSSDLNTWTNFGAVFTVTNRTWRAGNYWDVENWNSLFFRLQVVP